MLFYSCFSYEVTSRVIKPRSRDIAVLYDVDMQCCIFESHIVRLNITNFNPVKYCLLVQEVKGTLISKAWKTRLMNSIKDEHSCKILYICNKGSTHVRFST